MSTKVDYELSEKQQQDGYATQDAQDDGLIADTIPERYRGTAVDHHDMRALGKPQVLRRNFKMIQMVAFANTVMIVWETFLVVSGLGLSVGGKAPVFWGLVYGSVAMTCVYVTIAEMARIAPTSGGQYHWVSELAPASMQKFLSYITGWLVSMGWMSYLTLTSFTAALTIQGLAALNYPDYVSQRWHTTLLTWGVVVFGFLFNTALAPRLPAIEVFFFGLHLAGWLSIFIVLLVLAPRDSASTTFTVFLDEGDWGSVGLAAVITMSNSAAILIGYESPVHMCEETQDASRVIPRVILWGVVMNIAMAVALCGAYLSAIGDLTAVLSTPTGTPFIQVLLNVTGSPAGTTCMASIVVAVIISAVISEGACASRQIWSFARDNGLPGSAWLTKVTPGYNIPVNAVVTTTVVVALISLINIGSSAALNAINSLGGISILATYLIVIGCYIYNRITHARPPRGAWSPYGLYSAIAGWLMVAPMFFFLLWPLASNPNAVSMNWAIAMSGGVVIIATLWYFVRGRATYTAPVAKVKHIE